MQTSLQTTPADCADPHPHSSEAVVQYVEQNNLTETQLWNYLHRAHEIALQAIYPRHHTEVCRLRTVIYDCALPANPTTELRAHAARMAKRLIALQIWQPQVLERFVPRQYESPADGEWDKVG